MFFFGYPYQATIIVMSFAELITKKPNHMLCFDNYSTSYNLLSNLTDMEIRAACTVFDFWTERAHLKDRKCLQSKKDVHLSRAYTCDGRICVRWSENSVVTCASTFDAVNPVKNCSHTSKVARTGNQRSATRDKQLYLISTRVFSLWPVQDSSNISNYQPILNLTFVLKVICWSSDIIN